MPAPSEAPTPNAHTTPRARRGVSAGEAGGRGRPGPVRSEGRRMPTSHPPALRVSDPPAPYPGPAGGPPAYFAFARFSLTKSQLTSLSKNVCTHTGRRFW